MNKIVSILIAIVFFVQPIAAQTQKSNAHITGQVTVESEGERISFATISLKGTVIGTTTNEMGNFRIENVKPGTYIVNVHAVGFKTKEYEIVLEENKTKDLKIELTRDVFGLDEVVVTGDRYATRRRDASVIVSSISPKVFEMAQASSLSEGLNFALGVRMETDCQNCGFSQVRMNGMEGSYSQILVNGRPIFSGLAGVYGLELIPSSMIDKVEVVRGGGSAIYGSNAIAGSINMILRDPVRNSYELGINSNVVGVGIEGSGTPSIDNSTNFNASVVSDDLKQGLSVFGFHRKGDHFDVDNDGFSEITDINNTTVGTRFFNQFGNRGKITFNYFHINESRRGGNEFKKPEHEAGIAESLKHKINSGSLVYDQFLREKDKLSIYASAQNVNRNAYYGGGQDLSAYGNTRDMSYNFGASYNAILGAISTVTAGVENTGGWLRDDKLGYLDLSTGNHTDNLTISDQKTNTTGIFAQYKAELNKFTATIGGRFDIYKVTNEVQSNQDQDGIALVPRVSLLYDLLPELQLRASYSQGYRAPQMFDEDLHIEIAGAKEIRTKNADDLKKETSNSYMLSADFNKKLGNVALGFLVEGFYTHLNDAFVSTLDLQDDGTMVHIRENAEDGASIAGVNLELKLIPFKDFSFTSSFTVQKSEFEKEQDIDDYGVTKESRFLRTPDVYGSTTIDWDFAKGFELSILGYYTGTMLTPYAGTEFKNDEEKAIAKKLEDLTVAEGLSIDDTPYSMIRETPAFFELGAKLSYTFRIGRANMNIYTGIKNIANSYQDDFDSGEGRDAGYIYGPRNPRTIYFGVKIGI